MYNNSNTEYVNYDSQRSQQQKQNSTIKFNLSDYNPPNPYSQDTQPSQPDSNNQQLEINTIDLHNCNLLLKDSFHAHVVTQLQKKNPQMGPLQILTEPRVQFIKNKFQRLQKLSIATLGGDIFLWFLMMILYFTTFSDYGLGFIKFMIVFSVLAWLGRIGLFAYSCIKFDSRFLKLSFLVLALVILFDFIAFCAIAGHIGGGYIFMIICQLLLQGGQVYIMFLMNNMIEQIMSTVYNNNSNNNSYLQIDH